MDQTQVIRLWGRHLLPIFLALRFCFLEPIIPLPFGDFQGAEANEKVESLKVPLWFLLLADHPEVPKFKALLCRTQVERGRELSTSQRAPRRKPQLISTVGRRRPRFPM